MPKSFTGGCACGAVRYECTSRPLIMLNCHCRDCQQISGGPYIPVVYVPAKAFRLTQGELRYHSTPSASGGGNRRGFCPDCGSRLTGAESERGLGLTASSLDDPSWFRASMNIWMDDAQPWDVVDPALPSHPGGLPGRAG